MNFYWCKHIFYDRVGLKDCLVFSQGIMDNYVVINHKWKFCPICGKIRPKLKKL